MKNFFLITAILGLLGVGVALAVMNATGKQLDPNGQMEEAEKLMYAVRKPARERSVSKDNAEVATAYCKSTHYDFGLMDPLTRGSHVFVIG